MSDITLFYARAACSLAVRIGLEDLDLAYEDRIVDIKAGETGAPAFLAVNPKGRVPVLVTAAGDTLTEAPAILVYLALSHPDAGLLPADPLGHARALEWLSELSGVMHGQGYGGLWRSNRFSDDPAAQDGIRARAARTIADQSSRIDARLSGRDWALGDRYSVVDAFLLVFYLWGRRGGTDMAGLYPNWHAQAERVLARPAVQRALAREGLAQPLPAVGI
ncbi:glutathione S-transferase N-terminal domain-containing protein [Tistrella bauzanensis]|uniref:Glutathione S-transferase N-terminal domain-containing protein n=1 Tax=Tistrella arctica TaxID=3133430 RepID=A0ABU9YMB0_9PROT